MIESTKRVPQAADLPWHALNDRGLTLTRLDLDEQAIEAFQAALESAPEEQRSYLLQNLAIAQLADDPQQAVDTISRAIESCTEPVGASGMTYTRGLWRMTIIGDPETAAADFGRVIEARLETTLVHAALRARAKLRTELDDVQGPSPITPPC